MARRRSPASPRKAPAAPKTEQGLAPHAKSLRVQELLKERSRLLRDVQKKQAQLERLKEQASRQAQEAHLKMAPIVERQLRLSTELEALFEELLRPGRLQARARKEVERLRRMLELQGLLGPFDEDDEDDEDDDGDEDLDEEDLNEIFGRRKEARGSPRPSSGPHRPAERPPTTVPGASQVGQERRSLRDIFRNLARAIHPDQARQDSERERRTELMKQATRAYEDGDLARLVELESAWQSEKALDESGDPEVRCRELERINRELLTQLRDVTRQLRDAKYDLRDATMALPPDELVELANAELDDMEAICEHVRRFRDGKISLQDLAYGPLPRQRSQPRKRRKRRV